ncbi:MAG TPA: response regulator [Bacteroidota bacterium]
MKRVLVVDDEAEYRRLVGSLLTNEGFDVVVAANGREALDRLEEQPVDFIVSDIYMPVMDGIKLHRAVRTNPKWEKLPFLFVSAYDDRSTSANVRDARYDGFLKKARPVGELLDWMEYLMTPEDQRTPSMLPGGARSRLNAQIRASRRGRLND